MNPSDAAPAPPKLTDLARTFVVLSLSGFGGVAAQARYHLVTRRRWLSDREFADSFGIGQILPGANIANLSVIVGDRFAGPLGAVVCLAALCLPSLTIAVGLSFGAAELTAVFPRFAAVEGGISAAAAGLILSNGLRVSAVIWMRARGAHPGVWRAARLCVSLLTLALIAGLGILLPIAIVVMMAASIVLERNERP
jgi:chromate transporter